MPQLTTAYFEEMEYSTEAVFQFPAGLPGFEDQTEFLFIEQPHTRPLVFIQSLGNPSLCFLALPVLTVDREYRLSLSSEELGALALPAGHTPKIGADIGCFVLITVAENADPTVNLMSPIVVNLAARRGVQAIPATSEYSLRHPLPFGKETVSC